MINHKKSILAIIIFVLVAGVYLSNGRYMTSGDCAPNKYIAISLLNEFNLNLDEFEFLYRDNIPYYLEKVNQHYYSLFPVGSGLMAVPVFTLARILGIEFTRKNVLILDKISASILVALSAVFVFLALIELTNPVIAIILTVVYSFGTCSWSTSCQSLWSHSSSQLLNAVSLWIFVKGLRIRKIIPLAGFFMGIAILCRPTNIVVFIIMLIYVFHKYRNLFIKLLLYSIPPLLLYFTYNLSSFGHFLGGYSIYSGGTGWKENSILLLLFSPSKGLFIYSSVMILSFWGIYDVWRKRKNVLLMYLSLIPIAYIIIYSTFINWWGGFCFGNRYFADPLPFFIILMVVVFNKHFYKKWFKVFTGLLIICSIWVQYIGANQYDFSWDKAVNNESVCYTFNFWSLKRSQLLYCIKNGRIPTSEKKKKEYYTVKNNIIDFKEKESEKYIAYGFSGTEEWGNWGIGSESKLYFHIPNANKESRNVILTATFYRIKNKPQIIRIYFNDKLVKEHEFTGKDWEWKSINFKLPGEYFNNNVEELKFVYSQTKQISFLDTRMVSVRFKNIKIF